METRTKTKLVTWPSPQDYNEAIQNLAANTADPQLRNGHVHLTNLGLPRPLTGAFASVYRVDSHSSAPVAVRCFLRDIRDQETRYEHISNFVQNDSLPYTVTFDFLRNGIRVGANWFPALKMDWVSGPNLDQYIANNLQSQHKLARLALDFCQMCHDLREAGIAHGDLQHGNIIIASEGIRLVDYDGMYVPAMSGMHSNELGHRNYQHPSRAPKDFNANLDNFAAWVIHTSICCTALDSSLWNKLAAGDDCLLFRRDDFVQPEHSYAFNLLEKHSDPDIRHLAQHLRWLCHKRIEEVPPLTAAPRVVPSDLPPLRTPIRAVQTIEIASAPKRPAEPIQTETVPASTGLIVGVEDELNQPIPRWVAKTADPFASVSSQDRELVTSGLPARSIQFSIHRVFDASAEMTLFEGHYKFAVRGHLYKGRARFPESAVTSLANVKQVTILYDPRDPSRNAVYAALPLRAVKLEVPTDVEPCLKNRERWPSVRSKAPVGYYTSTLLTTLIATMFFIGCTAFFNSLNFILLMLCVAAPFAMLLDKNNTQRLLVTSGVPARARVIEVHNYKDGSVSLKYRYKAYSGPVQETIVTRDPALTATQLGDKITVLYDIDSPSKHVIYAISAYQVE